jgi:uncharacterized membrane protein
MSQFDPPVPSTSAAPSANLITMAHVVYGLFLFGCLSTMTWFIPVASLITLSWIAGVVLVYLKRGEAQATWLATHFRWQLRTFWFGLLWSAIAWLLILTLIGALLGGPMLVIVAIWLIYRILRGWILLNDGKPVPGM